ncbi:MAG: NAD(P)H-dependent oxidoreductase [Sporolactobacillus sp.]
MIQTDRNEQTKTDILNALHFRHACKLFDAEKKISEDDFAFILETGRLSPSSFGLEPWKFVVLQNKEIREKLAAVAWGAVDKLKTASHFVLILSRKANGLAAQSAHVQHMLKDVQKLPDNVLQMMTGAIDNFEKNDFQLTANDRVFFEWGCRQDYLAASNMMTAAAQIGIDSCPMEGFDKVKVESLLASEGVLDEKEWGIACMVAFGYRAKEPRPKTRQSVDDVVQWIR